MTAHEMFKKLGYQKTEEPGIIHYEKYEHPCYREICFIHKGQLIDAEKYNAETYKTEYLRFSSAEIRAIYKQMEELGWLS